MSTGPWAGGPLAGRRVVVVGVGGLGGAVARLLADDGAAIFGTYRSRPEAARELAAELEERWAGQAALDLTDAGQTERVLGAGGLAGTALGGAVDTLVVTAGHRHPLRPFAETGLEDAQEVVATELLGPMAAVRAVLPGMVEAGFGRIVCLGSDSGKAGTLGDAASSAARAGINGFVRSIAREGARAGVTANVVSPGPTRTELLEGMLAADGMSGKVMAGTVKAIPVGRTGEPAEVARAVAYLVGPDSGFVTGQVLSVSGGLTM